MFGWGREVWWRHHRQRFEHLQMSNQALLKTLHNWFTLLKEQWKCTAGVKWLKCSNMDYLSKVNENQTDEAHAIKRITNKCQDIELKKRQLKKIEILLSTSIVAFIHTIEKPCARWRWTCDTTKKNSFKKETFRKHTRYLGQQVCDVDVGLAGAESLKPGWWCAEVQFEIPWQLAARSCSYWPLAPSVPPQLPDI